MRNSNVRQINRQGGGVVSWLVIIICILIILHYLGIDVTTILNKQWVREFFVTVIASIKAVWQDIILIFRYFKNLINTTK